MYSHDQLDWRQIENAPEIPSEHYTDQPYLLRADDGAWLCCVTTGPGREGKPGQHVITMRSFDQGKTWQDHRDLERSDAPESAYAVMLKLPSGRIFAFYNYNEDNIRSVVADPGEPFFGVGTRVDCLGYFVFRYSDDHGVTWSAERFKIPVRMMGIDRSNPYQGKIRFFWNVGKPFLSNNEAFVPLIKVGNFGSGCYTRTEGVLLRCSNICDADVTTLAWKTLPDGDFGIRPVEGGGTVAEEQSFVELSDGSFFVVFRTVDSHPGCAYSRDRGRTWTPSAYMRDMNGRLLRHPRAANFVWKYTEGKYLYWFHNHGGRDFQDRNPAWICAGTEADSPAGRVIRWGQPELLLYDLDPRVAMSYPDLLLDGPRAYVSETQKRIGRIHRIDDEFLRKIFQVFEKPAIATAGLLFEDTDAGSKGALPPLNLPRLAEKENDLARVGTRKLTTGFTLEFELSPVAAGTVLIDNRDEAGCGLVVAVASKRVVRIQLNDGQCESSWQSDEDSLQAQGVSHVAVIIDGGPSIISFVVDGVFSDGGCRQFGWGRIHPAFDSLNTGMPWRLSPALKGLRVYARALLTAEAVMNTQCANGTE
jgi:hypothetical protein